MQGNDRALREDVETPRKALRAPANSNSFGDKQDGNCRAARQSNSR